MLKYILNWFKRLNFLITLSETLPECKMNPVDKSKLQSVDNFSLFFWMLSSGQSRPLKLVNQLEKGEQDLVERKT